MDLVSQHAQATTATLAATSRETLSAEEKPRAQARLYSRNWAFISPELQSQLAQVTVLCAGTGLGSVIADLAARTGFQRFILCDGDAVAEHNLNRQAFQPSQIGVNKASAIGATVKALIPSAQVEVVERYVGEAEFEELVPRADIVINTIDLESPAFLTLNRVAEAHRKVVLFPMNLGWGGSVLVFTPPQSLSLEEFINLPLASEIAPDAGARDRAPKHDAIPNTDSSGERDNSQNSTPMAVPAAEPRTAEGAVKDLATHLIMRVLERLPGGMPSELRALVPLFQRRTADSWPYDPQLGIAAHMTAALSVRTCLALVAGQPVKVAPDVIWCDAATAVAPTPPPGDDQSGEGPKSDGSGETRNTGRRPPPAVAMVRRLPDDAAALFLAPQNFRRHSYYDLKRRPGTGLIVIAARHDALLTEELAAISAYRLRQYVLAGLYDRSLVEQLELSGDPALDALAAHDLHVAVGDEQGRFLCYLCVQSPLESALATTSAVDSAAGTGASTSGMDPNRATAVLVRQADQQLFPRLRDHHRQLFPAETEYGVDLYGTHPGMQWLPLAAVRELSRLVRNQELGRMPLTEAATAETILAAEATLSDPQHGIEAIVGCMAPEARRLLYNLRIPIAYASSAPILGDNQGGGVPGEDVLLWTSAAHVPGRFWPYALAVADLRAQSAYFDALDTALAQPDLDTVIAAVGNLRHTQPHHRPRYVVNEGETAVVWTANPFPGNPRAANANGKE